MHEQTNDSTEPERAGQATTITCCRFGHPGACFAQLVRITDTVLPHLAILWWPIPESGLRRLQPVFS